MKRLYLLRHAKSDRSIPGLDDFDRPLNPRGERQIQEMGRFLKKRTMFPQRICSSPAKRALKTAEGIAGIIGFPAAKIRTVDAMYSSSAAALLKIIHKTDDDVRDLMLVGTTLSLSLAAIWRATGLTASPPAAFCVSILTRVPGVRIAPGQERRYSLNI